MLMHVKARRVVRAAAVVENVVPLAGWRLARLRHEGILSGGEFETAKREILRRLWIADELPSWAPGNHSFVRMKARHKGSSVIAESSGPQLQRARPDARLCR